MKWLIIAGIIIHVLGVAVTSIMSGFADAEAKALYNTEHPDTGAVASFVLCLFWEFTLFFPALGVALYALNHPKDGDK